MSQPQPHEQTVVVETNGATHYLYLSDLQNAFAKGPNQNGRIYCDGGYFDPEVVQDVIANPGKYQ